MISKSAVIHPNVEFGKNVTVEDFCVIGAPFKGVKGEKTFIGDNAVIRSMTVIYAGCRIGKNFQTGNKANIRELNDIGDNVSIGTMAVVEHHVMIEDGVRIHSQAFVPEYCVLKKNCWIGPNAVLTNAKYPKAPDAKKELKGVVVEENAKLGANVTVIPGVIIGKNSLVGAGSVVTKNLPADSVAAGVPAKFLRKTHY